MAYIATLGKLVLTVPERRSQNAPCLLQCCEVELMGLQIAEQCQDTKGAELLQTRAAVKDYFRNIIYSYIQISFSR